MSAYQGQLALDNNSGDYMDVTRFVLGGNHKTVAFALSTIWEMCARWTYAGIAVASPLGGFRAQNFAGQKISGPSTHQESYLHTIVFKNLKIVPEGIRISGEWIYFGYRCAFSGTLKAVISDEV